MLGKVVEEDFVENGIAIVGILTVQEVYFMMNLGLD